ncbi:tripartite tricarboxylate transporter substrate binding protein [Hydrogenophaga sp.]|uniref:Bug family tripartite tricarboxylate transporter substrate binding protein n=1 Tax=Hydrogenophaga sp. TaxID=1904254 RepID=UPI00272FF54F|nr:tripartite tricarboxylate transporter substrate binding protein [Hydrogenophaga sp.]MDP1684587.1 tripartite tricarboxylate transporter substrate binding protein [Hydrogenophaga sp.]
MNTPPLRWTRRAALATLAGAALLPLGSWAETAQAFPTRPIRIIMPFAPGGTTDVLARSIGQKMTELWGQPVIVDNRPGAAGWMGISAMARTPADGYTIGVTISNIIYAKSLYTELPFNMEKDFAPVSIISRSPIVLAVLPDFPANNVKEFVDVIRKEPGKHAYASFGQGTTAHIFGETLKLNGKLDMVHVPYKGAAAALQDLLGKRVSSAFLDTGTVLPLLQAGRIKVVGMSGLNRLPVAPQIQTFLEQGFTGFEPVGFFQVLAPAGTPPDIVQKLSDAVARTVNAPEMKKRILDWGQEPVGSTPEALATAIRSDADLFDRTIRRSNIKIDTN